MNIKSNEEWISFNDKLCYQPKKKVYSITGTSFLKIKAPESNVHSSMAQKIIMPASDTHLPGCKNICGAIV